MYGPKMSYEVVISVVLTLTKNLVIIKDHHSSVCCAYWASTQRCCRRLPYALIWLVNSDSATYLLHLLVVETLLGELLEGRILRLFCHKSICC